MKIGSNSQVGRSRERPAGRRGGGRLWDLATRVYPEAPVVPAGQALRISSERRLGALGIARARGSASAVEPADVGEVGEPAVVAGVRGSWLVDSSQLGQRFSGRRASIHQDVPFTEAVTAAVGDKISDLARWLGLELALPG